MSAGDVDVTTRGDVDKLKGNAVGLYSILFLCVTGSAPLAVLMFNTPLRAARLRQRRARRLPLRHDRAHDLLGRVRRDGQKVRAAGGMYTFVSHGLGQAWGLMAGYSLMIAYTIFGVALIGGFSAFTQAKWLQYSGIARSTGSGSRCSPWRSSCALGLLRRPDLGEASSASP